MANQFDPITTEIIQSSLQAAADEMFAAMRRTAMSAIIYEVLDMGTGITDGKGELASSGAGIPAFVGMLDKSVKAIINKFTKPGDIEPGDIFVTNDPFNGGVTHLNDVIFAMPVFCDGDIIAWTANMAHWQDVGGMAPGSMSADATEIFQEGLQLPAIKIFSRGEQIQPVFDILEANSRMPDFMIGDLWAGVASIRVGERRILEMVEKYGKDIFLHSLEKYMDYGEEITLAALKTLPHGKFKVAELQDDGTTYTAVVEITDTEFIVDLTDNPPQSPGPYNISKDGVVVAAQMVMKSVTSPSTICNGGTFRPLKVITKPGTVFDPERPAAMGIYYEIDVRLYDVILRAMSEKLPYQLPAGNFASVVGTLFGGTHPDTGRPYSIIEPELGGWGGNCRVDGNNAVFCGFHGETYNCPVEITEARNGVRVDRLSFHNDDGGEGKYRGGKGICLEYRIRCDDGWLTAAYTRSIVPPWSLEGGRPGSTNYIELVRANGDTTRHNIVAGDSLKTDDVIRVVTATGAGWGDPLERDLDAIKDDLKNGYITEEQANKYYQLDKRS